MGLWAQQTMVVGFVRGWEVTFLGWDPQWGWTRESSRLVHTEAVQSLSQRWSRWRGQEVPGCRSHLSLFHIMQRTVCGVGPAQCPPLGSCFLLPSRHLQDIPQTSALIYPIEAALLWDLSSFSILPSHSSQSNFTKTQFDPPLFHLQFSSSFSLFLPLQLLGIGVSQSPAPFPRTLCSN